MTIADSPSADDRLQRREAMDLIRRTLQAPAPEGSNVRETTPTTLRRVNAVVGWDRYRLTALQGEGSLGRVWAAWDRQLGREVALKELRPELLTDEASRSRFLVEARLTGGLEHPYIVRVHDLYDSERPFYTMELIKGRTLREWIVEYHALPTNDPKRPVMLRRLIEAYLNACEAIDFAGRAGVVHRDLKPANVIADARGEACVVDWGLAKQQSDAPPSANQPPEALPLRIFESAVNSVIGTPAYMAPEQATGLPNAADHRTDVFGLGAILYSVLTNKPPHPADAATSCAEFLRRVASCEVVPPNEQHPGVSPVLTAICMKALARDRDRRYQSAGELAEDVRRWIHREPTSVFREPFSRRTARWMLRHRGISLAAAGGVMALVLTAIVLFAQTWADAQNMQTALLETARARVHSTVQQLRLAADRPLETMEFAKESDDIRELTSHPSPLSPAAETVRTRAIHTMLAVMRYHSRLVTAVIFASDPDQIVVFLMRPYPGSGEFRLGGVEKLDAEFQAVVRKALTLEAGEYVLSPVHRAQWREDGRPQTGLEVHYAIPVHDASKRKVLGAVAMTVQFAPIEPLTLEFGEDPSSADWGGSVQVAADDGEVLSRVDRRGYMVVDTGAKRLEVQFPELAPLVEGKLPVRTPVTILRSQPSGDLVYAVQVELSKWKPVRRMTVASAIPDAEFASRERQAAAIAFASAAFIVLVGAGMIWFFAQLVGRIASG